MMKKKDLKKFFIRLTDCLRKEYGISHKNISDEIKKAVPLYTYGRHRRIRTTSEKTAPFDTEINALFDSYPEILNVFLPEWRNEETPHPTPEDEEFEKRLAETEKEIEELKQMILEVGEESEKAQAALAEYKHLLKELIKKYLI